MKSSQMLKDVVDAMFVTVFMARISTILASIVATPLSFLAAGNITRKSLGDASVYSIFRSLFTQLRSYDPLVMASISAFLVIMLVVWAMDFLSAEVRK